ncbi:hypothetical protein D918_03002 [Trichuris suis]|nr:hypothetical protein D918_03002 [Trichuris suis]
MTFLYLLAILLLRQSTAQEQLYDYETEKELFKAKVATFLVTQLRPITVKDFVTHGYGKCPHNGRRGYGIVYGMMNVSCPYDEAVS